MSSRITLNDMLVSTGEIKCPAHGFGMSAIIFARSPFRLSLWQDSFGPASYAYLAVCWMVECNIKTVDGKKVNKIIGYDTSGGHYTDIMDYTKAVSAAMDCIQEQESFLAIGRAMSESKTC